MHFFFLNVLDLGLLIEATTNQGCSHLQRLNVKLIDYTTICQGKVMKGHWSQNLQFWLRNSQKLPQLIHDGSR